jgi:tetratricopeptide (TPR) repeat protein
MTSSIRRPVLACLTAPILVLAGCGDPRTPADTQPAYLTEGVPATAELTLDQIEPVPEFPEATITDAHTVSSQAIRYFRRGRERFNDRLWADAVTALERAVQMDPDYNDARILLARACLQNGNFAIAEQQASQVLRRDPRSATTHLILGRIAFEDRNWPEVIRSLRLALRAGADAPDSPEMVLTHLYLGMALKEEGYLRAAGDQLEAYARAMRQPTVEISTHLELGQIKNLYRALMPVWIGEIQSALGNHRRAAQAYQEAIDAGADDPELVHKLILELARAGQANDAIDRAQALLAESPADEQLLSLLQETCELAGHPGRFDEVLVDMARSIDDPAVVAVIASRLLDRAARGAAIEALASSFDKHPDDAQAASLLARLYCEEDKPSLSLSILQRLIAARPDALADVQSVLDGPCASSRRDALIRAAASVVRDDSCGPAGHLLHALLIIERDPKRAMAAADAALRLDDAFVPAMIVRGRVLAGGREWEKCLSVVQGAMDRGAASAELYLLKGRAETALDHRNDAETSLLEAFRRDSTLTEALLILAETAERYGEALRCEQLYRRILDDVDPRCVPARERLIRLMLKSRKISKVREYLSDFKKLEIGGAAPERCRALFDVATSRLASSDERLQQYRGTLREIIERFPEDAETLLDMAMTYEAEGDFDQALATLNAALAIDPRSQLARDQKARYQARMLDFAGAAATIVDLLKDRPNDEGYQRRLAELSINQGEFDAAIELLRRMAERTEDEEARGRFLSRILQVLAMAERYDDAVTEAHRWLEGEPDHPSRRSVYLAALRLAERYDEAVESARKWLAEDPTSMDLRRQLVDQLIAAKRPTEGILRVLGWMSTDADDEELNRMLIQLFGADKQWDSAIEMATIGAENPRERDRYLAQLGQVYRLARRFGEAVELFRSREGSRIPGADMFVIGALIEAERFREAEAEIDGYLAPQLALRDAGQDYDTGIVLQMRRFLATLYQLTGRIHQCIQQLEEMHELLPHDAGTNNDLGYTLAEAGRRLDDAERMIRLAVGEEPLNGAYLDSLGWVLYKRGDFRQSVDYLRRAIRFTRDEDPVLFDHLADMLYRLGQKGEAKLQWTRALELCDPKRDPPPDAERRRLGDRIKKKLAQLDAGDPVTVAEIGEVAPNDDASPGKDDDAAVGKDGEASKNDE